MRVMMLKMMNKNKTNTFCHSSSEGMYSKKRQEKTIVSDSSLKMKIVCNTAITINPKKPKNMKKYHKVSIFPCNLEKPNQVRKNQMGFQVKCLIMTWINLKATAKR